MRASPVVAALRADRARTVLEVAALLALAARADCTTAPTWSVLTERSGYSERTVARVLAWLREVQLLVTVENGSTPQFRPGPQHRPDRPDQDPVAGNRCAVYLLTEPLPDLDDVDQVDQARDQSEHYASSQVTAFSDLSSPGTTPGGALGDLPRRGARGGVREGAAAGPGVGTEATPDGGGLASHDHLASPGSNTGYRRGPRGTKGAQRAADLAVAAALRARSLDLRPMSDRAVRSALRPQLADGWGVEDFVRGIDYAPDGTARAFTAGPVAGALPAEVDAERRRRGVIVDSGARPARAIASPGAWLASRLAPWAGHPAPEAARRAEAVARAEAARAAAAARRVEAAAAAAAAVPPPPVLAEARAALRARRTYA